MATITAVASGKWNEDEALVWDTSTAPILGDKIIIPKDIEIILDGICECGTGVYTKTTSPYTIEDNFSIYLKGTIKASRVVDSELRVAGMIGAKVTDTTWQSTLDFGTIGDPIPENIIAKYYNNPSKINPKGYYSSLAFFGTSNTKMFTISFVSARHRIRNTILINKYTSGTTSIEVEDSTGWIVGDELILAPKWSELTTRPYENYEYETVTITSISGNIIGISETLYEHGYTQDSDKEMGAVSNKSSNVIISGGDNSSIFPTMYTSRGNLIIKNVSIEYANNRYNYNSPCVYINYGSYYNSQITIMESNFIETDYSGYNANTSTVVYLKGSYENNGQVSVEDVSFLATNYSNTRYSARQLITYYSGTNTLIENCNLYHTSKYLHSAFENYQQPSTIKKVKIFNSYYGFRLHDNVDTNTLNCWIIGGYYSMNTYNGTAIYEDTHLRYVQYIGYMSSRWRGKAILNKIDFSPQHIASGLGSYIKKGNPLPEGNEYRLLDVGNNNQRQEVYYSYGVIIRDIEIYNSKVASIKMTPKKSNLTLKYNIRKFVNEGQTLNVEVYGRKNNNYNGSFNPMLRIKSNEFNLTQEMSNTNNIFEQLSLNTPTIINSGFVDISLETTGYAGYAWFDDLYINNDIIDIGKDIFRGGTEISTVVDITDTSVPINITVIDASSKVSIEGARVLLTLDDEVIINDVTNINGKIEILYDYTNNKNIKGKVRHGNNMPYYKTSVILGTLTNKGFEITVLLIKDI